MNSKHLAAVAAAIVGLVISVAPAGADVGAIFVDDDRADCPRADAQTINEGVALADPGDVVHVCPGLYAERVQVPKTILLDGQGPDAHIRVGDPTREAVVRGGFLLSAPEIVLDGFTIVGAREGVRTSRAFSGYVIRKNAFLRNVDGLSLASDGALPTEVRENDFRQNRFAIVSNLRIGPLVNARIDVNRFAGDDNAISLTGSSDAVVIDNNAFFGSRMAGIDLGDASRVEVTHNAFEGVTRPIRMLGNGRDNLFAYNDIERSRIGGIASTGSVFNSRVEYNRVVQTQGNAIMLEGFQRGVVFVNHLEANGVHGIQLGRNTRANTVWGNKSLRNRGDGIRVLETARSNRIVNNLADDNGEHDCHDDSNGEGTGGTANFWDQNLGDVVNRPAICMPTGLGNEGAATAELAPAEPLSADEVEAEPPCTPYSTARDLDPADAEWDAVDWVCDSTPDEVPAPDEPA